MAKKTGKQVVFEGSLKKTTGKGKFDSFEFETKDMPDGSFVKLRNFYKDQAAVRVTVTEIEPAQKSLKFPADDDPENDQVPGPEPVQ